MRQLRIYFSGHVQGVGFRQTAHRLAKGFEITGWVKNLSDGRVELLVEGDEREIQSFFKLLCDRMKQYIESTEVIWETALNQFKQFEIS